MTHHHPTPQPQLAAEIAAKVATQHPFTLGVSGAQGSGKSTLCRTLAMDLKADYGLRVVTISIDDLYLPRAERLALAQRVHPLCAIRGLPGSHDVALGVTLLNQLRAATPATVTKIPRFNKALDDRVAPDDFDAVRGRPDVIVLEGWCVGARPGAVWQEPVNARERADDPDGTWYQWTEAALRRQYLTLWQHFDGLVFIESPSFETIVAGRCHQEARLAEQILASGGPRPVGLMTQNEVVAYVQLFERKTRQMLLEMPALADWIVPHWMTKT